MSLVRTRREVAQSMGVLACLAGCALVVLWWLNRFAAHRGGHDLSGIIFFAPLPIIGGIGMLLLRKWGALVLALPLVITMLFVSKDFFVGDLSWRLLVASSAFFGSLLTLILWPWPALTWRTPLRSDVRALLDPDG